MHKIWQSEKQTILGAVAILVFGGLVSQQWTLTSLLVLSAYIAWLYRRLARLENWLAHGTKTNEVYDDTGMLGIIIRHLYQQKKNENKRKKKTKDILRRLNRNIAALPDATILINDQMEIEWSNQPAKYLLGVDPKHDLGQRVGNLIRSPAFLRYLIAPDKKDKLEMQSPLDSSQTLQIKIVRFGRNQRLLIARNISDQKQLQEGLKNFVANASHELKTPLTSILGNLEMLEDDNKQLSKASKKSLQVAQKQARRMQRLISDLLLLSQVESYQLQPDEGNKATLAEIMTNVMTSVEHRCEDLEIDCDYPGQTVLLCIRNEVESICINLIDNALKYSKDDPEVKIRWLLNDAGECVFKVTDNGMGISHRDQSQITERYFRGSEAAVKASGSGLGLAIVKQAAAKHGASLSFNSQLGHGSSFSVTFPSYRVFANRAQPEDNVIRLANL